MDLKIFEGQKPKQSNENCTEKVELFQIDNHHLQKSIFLLTGNLYSAQKADWFARAYIKICFNLYRKLIFLVKEAIIN